MTVYCKLCNREFTSDKPDDAAQKHVLEKLSAHIGTHQAEAAELAKSLMTGSQLLATFLLLKNFVTIPAGEKAMLESLAANERALRVIFELETQPTGAN